MQHARLREKLISLEIPAAIADELPDLPPSVQSVLLYGSRARGDFLSDSDVDLLALVPKQIPSISAGPINISFYTRAQIASGISSLFGLHLQRDGIILSDTDGQLAATIAKLGPVDTARLLARVQAMSALFTTPARDLPKYLPGLLREARYLLRSTLYANAIALGDPCFSVREIASRHGDPDLARLLSSRQHGNPSIGDYDRCLAQLNELIGEFPESRHGSLEATVVNEWGIPGDLLSMAFMALGSSGGGSDYAEVGKILL